jgi:DNA-binding NtrC family response regulator
MRDSELPARPSGRKRKKRILFVDDDRFALEGLAHLLRCFRSRCEMVFAEGGDAAIAELAAGDIDVLVTDLCMPGTDGVAVLAAAARHAPHCIRVVLTGSPADALELDVFAVVHKPVNVDELRALLDRVLRRR